MNPSNRLRCRICEWVDADYPAIWVARAPDGTYHFICADHWHALGHRYTGGRYITDAERVSILSGYNRFGRKL